ncbi:MAG: acyl-CoA synthetase [Candidatus Rokuibacteriota bacterium]
MDIRAQGPPAEGPPGQFNIGWECCDRWVENGYGEQVAVRFGDQCLSFSELRDLSNRIGNALLSCGLGRGERFLIRLPHIAEFYATVLAGLKIGSVPIPAPMLFRERELERVLTAADVRLVVTDDTLADPIRSIRAKIPTLRHILSVGKPGPDEVSFEEVVARASPSLIHCRTGINDPAFVLFTSGTTGQPTGIAHAHRAFNIARGNPCGRWAMDLQPDDVVFQPHDLAFSYSFGCGFLFPFHCGASVVASRERVPPEKVFEWIEKFKVTIFVSVPTMYRALLAVDGAEKRFDLSSLRRCISAGEPLSPRTYFEWKKRIGIEILEHIGQAELQMFCANVPQIGIKPGSLGKPLPGYRVAVLDEEGRECVRQVGHLVVGEDNPALFYEYVRMPEKWRETHRNGWYYTGDLAMVDGEGYFWYVSRADDLIKSRGYLISPREVEETLIDHPAVREVGVVGIRDAAMGQAVKAFVVLQSDHSPSKGLARDLQQYVKSRIAPYKAPKEIEFVHALPKTATGKILRRDLRLRSD